MLKFRKNKPEPSIGELSDEYVRESALVAHREEVLDVIKRLLLHGSGHDPEAVRKAEENVRWLEEILPIQRRALELLSSTIKQRRAALAASKLEKVAA